MRNKPRNFLHTTSDRMLGTVGLARRRDPLWDVWLPSLSLFAAGAVIGASAAVLLTPKPGPDMRRDLSEGAKDVTRKLSNGVSAKAKAAFSEEQPAQPLQS